jgi:hypothetical protein
VVLEDLEDLVDLAIPAEERFLFDELGEDASDGPNIHSQAVLPLSQQNLRSPIPEGLDLMGERLDGYAKGAGKSEIRNFKHS